MGSPLPAAVAELMAVVADPSRPAVERLRAADGLREALDAWLPTLADAARAEEGQSWATIGSALHITRQAAQQRFGSARRKHGAEAWNTDPGHDANVAGRRPG